MTPTASGVKWSRRRDLSTVSRERYDLPMDSTPVWVTVVIALAGLAGTIFSPVIQGGIAAGVEEKREQNEESRFKRESKLRRDELLFDSKREMFVRALALMEERYYYLHTASLHPKEDFQPKGMPDYDRWFTAWSNVSAEIGLLAPEVRKLVTGAHNELSLWAVALAKTPKDRELMKEHGRKMIQAGEDLRTSMRTNLNVVDVETEQ